MTRGVNIRWAILVSFGMASLSTLFTLPYFHYLLFTALKSKWFSASSICWSLLFTQLFLLFIICFLSFLVGLVFTKRINLPGLGNRNNIVRSLPFLLIIGMALIGMSYFFFDRHFYQISPLSYPKDLLYLISFSLKGAFAEEIILRFGLLTLCVGLLKNRVAGVVLISVLASLFSIKYFRFIGVDLEISHLMINQVLLSFAANVILGYLFVTKGLIHAMVLKFIFSMKYATIAWVMG